MTPARAGFMTATIFFLAALILSGIQPLWLDEIIQLMETRDKSAAAIMASLPNQAGSAPLGYLVQQSTLRIAGYSLRRSRLPAALFGAAAVFFVTLLGVELGLSRPWLASAIFGVFPLTLRYATESRIYSQALFFSVLATWIYLRLAKNPETRLTVLYWLALTLAIYTQPYAVFVGFAHVLWTAILRDFKTIIRGMIALIGAVVAFLPWYLWSHVRWTASIATTGSHFSITAKTPLMLFRELSGAGYWGAALLLILWALGAARRRMSLRSVAFLGLLIGAPIACVLAADARFDYFIAIRQFIWVLPAAAILAAAGAESYSRLGCALLFLLFAASLWQDARLFIAPHEDWQLAAATLAAEAKRGACVAVAPPDHVAFYQFFTPDLKQDNCESPRVVLAVTPYATIEDRKTAIAGLTARRYRQEKETQKGKTGILVFVR
jgi:hypothetical protein